MRKSFLTLLLTVFLSALSHLVLAQTTTVYLVRHAEKDLTDVNTKDPNLTRLGLQRAADLAKLLGDKNISAVFSSNYKRTLQTADPIAQKMKLVPIVYNPSDTKALAEKILQDYKGQTVLIVGHSNTLIPQTKALGGYTSFSEIEDSNYRTLIRLTINGTDVKTEELTYGN